MEAACSRCPAHKATWGKGNPARPSASATLVFAKLMTKAVTVLVLANLVVQLCRLRLCPPSLSSPLPPGALAAAAPAPMALECPPLLPTRCVGCYELEGGRVLVLDAVCQQVGGGGMWVGLCACVGADGNNPWTKRYDD